MYFKVYILRCRDGSYYVGHTDNLEFRLSQHQAGTYSGYTTKRRPVKLVFEQTFTTRDATFHAEQRIKGWCRKKKEALIRGDWDTIIQLSRI